MYKFLKVVEGNEREITFAAKAGDDCVINREIDRHGQRFTITQGDACIRFDTIEEWDLFVDAVRRTNGVLIQSETIEATVA